MSVDRAAAFAGLFEAVREGVYVGTIGAASNTTLAANPHLKQILGIPTDAPDCDVTPFACDRFTDADSRTSFLARLHTEGSVRDHLLRLRRADGSVGWFEVTANTSPIAGEAGAPATRSGRGGVEAGAPATRSGRGGVESGAPATRSGPGGVESPASGDAAAGDELHIEALIRDVSERKHNEEQSRDLYHQLLQAEKMAALGQTISGVAHELNNPLATILSWAERLSESPADDKSRRGLEVILTEAERAARIVRHLLTFARKRQTTRMMNDVNVIVRETLALRAYDHVAQNIQSSTVLAPGLPEVFVDGHQVKQVLLNLVINAEQAMFGAHGRGTLCVRTWHDRDRDSVVLEVADDGPGVAEETQGKIFDPFFTTKQVGGGTGLGLSVAYAIVQEHGGRIWLSSRPGAGASFFVELPISGDALQPRRPPPVPISLEAFKGLKVLVVEDEPALAAAVAEALTDAGFVVDRAGDGEEGLTSLTHATYDLVVCDLKMPRVDGMQFYRAMAAATPALARRVIFVTGDVAGTDAERFLEETGCRWLAKPFRLGDLLRAARDALA